MKSTNTLLHVCTSCIDSLSYIIYYKSNYKAFLEVFEVMYINPFVGIFPDPQLDVHALNSPYLYKSTKNLRVGNLLRKITGGLEFF